MNEIGTNFCSCSVRNPFYHRGVQKFFMVCVTALYAGVMGSSPIENEHTFVPYSFIHNPLYLYLIDSGNCLPP